MWIDAEVTAARNNPSNSLHPLDRNAEQQIESTRGTKVSTDEKCRPYFGRFMPNDCGRL